MAGLTIVVARGPLLSFIFIAVPSLLTTRHGNSLLSRKGALTFLAVLIPVFLAALSWVQSTETAQVKVQQKTAELSNLLEGRSSGSAGERLHLYKQAIVGFLDKPFVGWGLGSFAVIATGADTREYPHNLVLQIGVEQGLAGLLAFGAFLASVIGTLRKTVAATQGEWIFLLWVVLYLMVTTMFSGNLDDQRPLMLWCGMTFCSWRILQLRFSKRTLLWKPSSRQALASCRFGFWLKHDSSLQQQVEDRTAIL